jgi:hypothetical protein
LALRAPADVVVDAAHHAEVDVGQARAVQAQQVARVRVRVVEAHLQDLQRGQAQRPSLISGLCTGLIQAAACSACMHASFHVRMAALLHC